MEVVRGSEVGRLVIDKPGKRVPCSVSCVTCRACQAVGVASGVDCLEDPCSLAPAPAAALAAPTPACKT